MKKDMDDVTEKLGVNKDEVSSSDKQGNKNVEIINVSMGVKRWYSFANLVYALLVEPLRAKLPIWLVWLAAFAALFALAIVGVAE